MSVYLGDFAASASVHFAFTTHQSDGAPVAPSSSFESADLLIYKNASATARSSANGVTMTSPFNSKTGLHHVTIDLSDNTDAGFYAAGSNYIVVLLPDETVDSVAVTNVVAMFSIEYRSVGTGGTSAATIADAVWDEARAGHVAAGSFGEGVNAESLNTAAKGHVNAEVLDVLNVDTFAEPGQEAPGATVSLAKKIGYLYKFLRNKKTQTATTLSIFNDDAATVDHKSTVSDDGTTYTQSEVATGP